MSSTSSAAAATSATAGVKRKITSSVDVKETKSPKKSKTVVSKSVQYMACVARAYDGEMKNAPEMLGIRDTCEEAWSDLQDWLDSNDYINMTGEKKTSEDLSAATTVQARVNRRVKQRNETTDETIMIKVGKFINGEPVEDNDEDQEEEDDEEIGE